MKLIRNSGNDRVIDALREVLKPDSAVDIASPAFSLFAFAEVRSLLEKVATCRLVLPTTLGTDLNLSARKPTGHFAIVFRSVGSRDSVLNGSTRKLMCGERLRFFLNQL